MTKLFWILGGVAVVAIAGCAALVAGRNVEQPPYTSIALDGDFELRDYPELTVAEVTTTGGRQQAVSAGFGPLAGYIFAKERDGDKIAMTAPVTQTQIAGEESEDGAWVVRFIMPSEYTLDTLPRPAGSSVRLQTLPARRMAAVKFSGVANDTLIAEQEVRLLDWMTAQGLAPTATPTYAYYNDPFTPGFMRRNEAMMPVNK